MEYREGLKLIKEQLPLPACIGRVCPHPCETACRRQLVEEPISIAYLKSFLADIDLASDDVFMPELGEPTGKKVAIIGGGPGGLSAAYFLRVAGHEATIYEQMPEMGGMLRYGIPEYRLPGHVIDQEIDIIRILESRLDNLVYRIGFASSIRQARQMVVHGHVLVNGKKIDIPSYLCTPGDTLELREKSKSVELFKENFENAFLSSLPYITKDQDRMSGTFLRFPEREEVPIEIQDQLIVEYYS